MNSEKAAAVRDAINGCPQVVSDEDVQKSDSEDVYETTRHHAGTTEKRAGDRTRGDQSTYRPATIEESGTVAGDDGVERPVYVVVLETLWTQRDEVRSLAPELVYEVAKHDCRIRFYPPAHRLGGSIWITDHFSQRLDDANGDRCECGSTYFKKRDGAVECARCGADADVVRTTPEEIEA